MDITKNNNRNCLLDILKLACAFLVVCIHTPFKGSEYLAPYTKVAVPIFFMISGWFYSLTVSRGREKAQIKKIALILLFSGILYIFWDMFLTYLMAAEQKGLWDFAKFSLRWLFQLFLLRPRGWLEFLLFNSPPFSIHLWYLSAILYVLILMLLINPRIDRKKLYWLIPVLLCGKLVLGNYSVPLFGRQFGMIYSRNFLFFGLPFFLLGDMLHEYRERLRIYKTALWALLLVSLAAVQLERIMLSRAGYEHTELYISTIVSAGAVFILMVTARDHNGSVAAIALARRGRELSLGIFIVHPIFMHLLVLLQNSCRDRARALATMLDYTMPILVFFLSVITVRLFKPVSAKLMASVIGKKAP